MKMKSLAVAFCVAAMAVAAQAQSLQDMVREANSEWMFGKWEAQTDNGGAVTLNISWDLEKNLVVLHVKSGDMESKGFTVKDPASDEVKYFSVDTRGAVGKGTWGMESEELVLRTETQRGDRPVKAAFVFTGSAEKGLQVRMHEVDSSGGLSSEARFTLKMKKQK